MGLSKQWTVKSLWDVATSEIEYTNPVAWANRFIISSQIQSALVNTLSSLIGPAYMTPVVLRVDTNGSYGTAAMSYVVATRRLTATMSTAFVSTDVGKEVMFRLAGAVYNAFIETVVSGTVVVLSGSNLPVADIPAVDDVMMAPTAPLNDLMSIASLNIMRTGEQIRFVLESSLTRSVEFVSPEEMRLWRSSKKPDTIAYSVAGTDILLVKGDNLASYGTLVLWYPRVPVAPIADSDALDIPDGTVGMLALIMLKKVLVERYQKRPSNYGADITGLVKDLYQNAGATVSVEEIKKKSEALM